MAWDKKGAAAYLDRRMQWWSRWQSSALDHGTFCVSCHTALPYALARTALDRTLSQSDVAPQARLLKDVRERVRLWQQEGTYYTDADEPGKTEQSRGTEAVLNALILAWADASRGRLSDDARTALDQMWAVQRTTGPDAGAWSWLDFGAAPWEARDSQYYGAALAALATGVAPDGYRLLPQVQNHLQLLRDYLDRRYPDAPLHHRLMALWASAKLPGLLSSERRQAVIDDILRLQNSAGGWSLEALDPSERSRHALLQSSASDGYATALATLVLEQAAPAQAAVHVRKGLRWLMANQQGHLGLWFRGRESFWVSRSLNKPRNPWSNVGRFMSDAATAYAVLALTASVPSDRRLAATTTAVNAARRQ